MTSTIPHKHRYPSRARLLAFVCFCSAALRVSIGEHGMKKASETQQIMIRVDVSQSMQVADMPDQQTRLAFVKASLHQLLDVHPESSWGLGIFAGEAQSLLPLTTNNGLLRTFLDGVDHENLATQGSRLADALQLGTERFAAVHTGSKYMLVFSDGGDDPVVVSSELKEKLKAAGIHVIIVGVGTATGGPIIAGVDLAGNPQPKLREGVPIQSSLAEDRLRDLAVQLDGTYINLLAQPLALRDLFGTSGSLSQHIDYVVSCIILVGISSFLFGIVAGSEKRNNVL